MLSARSFSDVLTLPDAKYVFNREYVCKIGSSIWPVFVGFFMCMYIYLWAGASLSLSLLYLSPSFPVSLILCACICICAQCPPEIISKSQGTITFEITHNENEITSV